MGLWIWLTTPVAPPTILLTPKYVPPPPAIAPRSIDKPAPMCTYPFSLSMPPMPAPTTVIAADHNRILTRNTSSAVSLSRNRLGSATSALDAQPAEQVRPVIRTHRAISLEGI